MNGKDMSYSSLDGGLCAFDDRVGCVLGIADDDWLERCRGACEDDEECDQEDGECEPHIERLCGCCMIWLGAV